MIDAWSQILHILENTLNPGLYQVWIKPLDAEMRDGKLVLFAPNAFVASWVRDRLQPAIAEAATQALGRSIKLLIETRAKKVAKAAYGKKATPDRPGKAAPTGGFSRTRELGLPHLAAPKVSTFNWRFGFDDFIVGPSNELAFVASRGICQQRLAADQLFLNSAPGLGKTHLLHAIGRNMAAESNRANVRVGYLSAEEFASELVMALKSREMERFKSKYRQQMDVLLLEDIHFLQGKQKIQDELLATLNALQSRGCKVALSSSFLPRELKDVDEHLASRLCSGFLATIDNPCFETRRRILASKARLHQVVLPEAVADMLADNLKSDIRQLESCLQNLVLKAQLLGEAITMDMASQVLQNYVLQDCSTIGFQHIVQHICTSFDLSRDQLSSKSRKRSIVLARNTAFYLARKHTDLALKQIGSHFNRRHSTVLKGITNIERELSHKTPLGNQINTVIDKLRAR